MDSINISENKVMITCVIVNVLQYCKCYSKIPCSKIGILSDASSEEPWMFRLFEKGSVAVNRIKKMVIAFQCNFAALIKKISLLNLSVTVYL